MAREKGMGNLQQEKSGRWTARICVDGQRWSRSTRTKNRDLAEKFLQRMLAPLGLGERTLALAEVWREYVKSPNRRELAPSTMQAKRVVWMHFAEWMEKNHPEVVHLSQLNRDQIAEYLCELRIGHTACTYNNRVCVLREICHVLIEWSGVNDDPWQGVRLLADDSHSRRGFSIEELRRIVEAAERYDLAAVRRLPVYSQGTSVASGKNSFRLLFLIGIYTGLRLGDCCCLQWNEVDLLRGVIQVVPRKVRRHLKGHPITIPIHPVLAEALMVRRDSDFQDERRYNAATGEQNGLSTSESERYVLPIMAGWYLGKEKWRVGDGLARIFKNAGIQMSITIEGRRTATPDATFHSLRHTFVSLSANAGVPLPIVQSIVGHASTAMTRHYYHETEAALRQAIEAIPVLDKKGARCDRVDFCVTKHADQDNVSKSIGVRFRELEELLAEKVITRREYKATRARILSEL